MSSVAFAQTGNTAVTSATTVSTANPNALPLTADGYDRLLIDNRLSQTVNPNNLSTGDAIKRLFIKPDRSPSALVTSANIIIAALALLFLAITALRFIFSDGDEEVLNKAKGSFGYIILGLLIVAAALNFAFITFNIRDGNVLTDGVAADKLAAFINQIKFLMQILIAAIAAVSLIIGGYRLITSQGDEEAINKEKQFIKNFLLAAGLIAFAEVLVRGIFYARDAGGFSTDLAVGIGLNEIVGVINFLLGLVAACATFMLVLASIYYVISLGDEERAGRAKRIIISCIIGIALAISAYTVIVYFTQLR